MNSMNQTILADTQQVDQAFNQFILKQTEIEWEFFRIGFLFLACFAAAYLISF